MLRKKKKRKKGKKGKRKKKRLKKKIEAFTSIYLTICTSSTGFIAAITFIRTFEIVELTLTSL